MNDNDTHDERRESRLHAFNASLTASDRAKVQSIAASARESFGRAYGSRLSELMVDRAVDTILLSEEATVSIKSSFNQMPETRAGWDALVKRVSEADGWIKANLVSSDAKLKETMRAECMATLSPIKAIHLFRTGDLDGFVKNWIASQIQERMDAAR